MPLISRAKIATAVVEKLAFGAIDWLLGNLVPAVASGYLLAVINLEANFFAKMRGVIWVVTLDAHRLAVDKGVESEWRLERLDLLYDLSHFAVGQRLVVETVDARVVLEKNICPVVEQILLSGVSQDAVLPAMLLKHADKCFLKLGFNLIDHRKPLTTCAVKTKGRHRIAGFNSTPPKGHK